jgi:hypothetical protein
MLFAQLSRPTALRGSRAPAAAPRLPLVLPTDASLGLELSRIGVVSRPLDDARTTRRGLAVTPTVPVFTSLAQGVL